MKSDNSNVASVARKVLETNLLKMEGFDLKKITKTANITEEDAISSLEYIYKLDFHPGRKFIVDHGLNRDPELYVKKIKNKWEVFLVKSLLTRVEVNAEYSHLIKKNSRKKEFKTVSSSIA